MSIIKQNKKEKIVNLSILTILIFSLSVICMNNANTKETNSKEISNNKIGWGIKREDNHEQPDVGTKNKEVLENNNGICMGNKDKKYIYITFDEGYEAGYTPKILDVLNENNVKGTFFITAHYLNTQEELVKRMIDEGHIVGNHTPNYLMSRIKKV